MPKTKGVKNMRGDDFSIKMKRKRLVVRKKGNKIKERLIYRYNQKLKT
jgi:hypothetical protein